MGGCGKGASEVQPVGSKGVRVWQAVSELLCDWVWTSGDGMELMGPGEVALGRVGPGTCRWQGDSCLGLPCGPDGAAQGQQLGDVPLKPGCFVIASDP